MTSTYSINPEVLQNFPHVKGSYFLPFHVNHLDDLDGIESYIEMLGMEVFKIQMLMLLNLKVHHQDKHCIV